ncbi:MFS transporter [Methanosphaerula palustris]|uniref:Major facilitator superfamily MFS_1 n=1 Tax=Methanosphaerula palustris (strain ATCC BAA-1556 / DSM 19958 / E1-9c) TaxID=521011 RepID=B8GIA2_METPE|nr:MFS transporter [Methanosphaerula palustris]ACL15453.1 major facilitator superfamily MFS_1 [Methanosphaerula palustris E1-9c]
MSRIITDPLYQKLLLIAATIGMLLDGLDGSIVNVVLPQISESFGTDTGTVSWVVITYLLMMAGLILVFGKVAERGLLRKIFLGGLLIFTLGSAVCGLSPDFGILLVSRIFQGIGAAMIAASAPLLCVTYLPKTMLGMALGAMTMASSIGFAAGPAIGGFLTHYLSWHWVFLINIPIGLLALPFALHVIPEDNTRKKQPFDLFGAVALFGMMGFGVYTLERIPHLGITDQQIQICTVLCLVCTIAFLLRELRCTTPLMNIRVFTAWRFTAVFLAFLIMNVIYAGMLYLLPFFLQAGMQFDTAMSGLYLLIPPALTTIIGIPLGRWSDSIGRRPFALAACLVLIAVNGIYLIILPEMGVVPLLAGLILMGLFWGFAGGPVASRVVDHAPPGEEGTGSSLMVTAIYLGSVIGIALYATAFTITTAGGGIVAFSDLDLGTFMHGFHFSTLIGFVLSIATFVFSVIVRERREPAPAVSSSADE